MHFDEKPAPRFDDDVVTGVLAHMPASGPRTSVAAR